MSELRFGGQMCIKAYAHGKATVGEAIQVIRNVILTFKYIFIILYFKIIYTCI